MKILYAATLAPGNSAGYRVQALERLGHEVIRFETEGYATANALLRKVEFRLVAGPQVQRLNADLLSVAREQKPDVFWADKVLKLHPATLRAMRALGIASVSYMIDNAFGPRRDPGWRLWHKAIPEFDLHVTQRDVSMRDLTAHGARNVMKVQTAYEQSVHFPPPEPMSDAGRNRAVSFIGTPYDDRAVTLSRLSEAGVDVSINGGPRPWSKALSPAVFARVFKSAELYNRDYREAIWRSRINLSFLTHANQDEYTHKSFEIAGCGGFLLAERSPGHSLKFVEDEEAVFFDGFDELFSKIQRYLPDEAARKRIAAAGLRRAVRDGYHNDRQVALIVERLQQIAAARK